MEKKYQSSSFGIECHLSNITQINKMIANNLIDHIQISIPSLIPIDRLLSKTSSVFWIFYPFVLLLIIGLSFLLYPHYITYISTILILGLIEGVYWAVSDIEISQLKTSEIFSTNSLILKRLSIFQFIACAIAFFCYSSINNLTLNLSLAILLFIGASILINLNEVKNCINFKNKSFKFLSLLSIIFLFGCDYNKKNIIYINLPSFSNQISISKNNTYSESIITNSTSARIVEVTKDLALEGILLDHYKVEIPGIKYKFYFKPDYYSAKNDLISAEDVAYTLKYFYINHPDLVPFLKNIKDMKKCKNVNCEVSGLNLVASNILEIHLSNSDFKFVEKLSSPWLVILKKGKETYEKIGHCKVPYQTGSIQITDCNENKIVFSKEEKTLELHRTKLDNLEYKTILTYNNSGLANATLTVLSGFFNPQTQLTLEFRKFITNNLRENSKEFAKNISLSHANTLAPKWYSISPDFKKDERKSEIKNFTPSCPKQNIKVLLDSSLPDHNKIQKLFLESIPCEIEFLNTTSNYYFENFSKADLGVAWFTPDYLDISNTYSIFSCKELCYFDWKDDDLEKLISTLIIQSNMGTTNKGIAENIEKIIYEKAYAIPFADMNWWIHNESSNSYTPIHPAGLFQVKISDFYERN